MEKQDFSQLKAMYVNCTLKKTPEKSHTAGLMEVSKNIMRKEGVQVEELRLIDHAVASGVYPNMTAHGWEKDEWPTLFERIFSADILIIGTPIWLGEKSSEAQKLIERLYSMSGKQNNKGQYLYYGKVGGCIITGNEDGVKHCAMGILYALQHIGYSIPPQADAGWIGEVGPGPSYLDKESGAQENDFTNRNTTFMTYNLLHLAKMLKEKNGYPAYGNSRKEWDNGNRWNFENPEYR
ncbi:multimeric flavodoxin WrbA [Roseivirga pacifica]|uniref:Multimeric flavodoxin WrbA n=1 Tax=Roseivirga pacifica TaxID=1267423 RepID=A0A1I0RQS6_9BACT|nr:NAD(P)H-dependent oxidoreductase [Roseivirga pacifica]RKQ49399.1 multimeric flavodoxin WrbA [Roseivirga pacifica]SEW43721.1 Multimeric flavodoxin WrbA [Roseivirga pacifica]